MIIEMGEGAWIKRILVLQSQGRWDAAARWTLQRQTRSRGPLAGPRDVGRAVDQARITARSATARPVAVYVT